VKSVYGSLKSKLKSFHREFDGKLEDNLINLEEKVQEEVLFLTKKSFYIVNS
jgi:hypothetical protein